jgi:hypothetical protein
MRSSPPLTGPRASIACSYPLGVQVRRLGAVTSRGVERSSVRIAKSTGRWTQPVQLHVTGAGAHPVRSATGSSQGTTRRRPSPPRDGAGRGRRTGTRLGRVTTLGVGTMTSVVGTGRRETDGGSRTPDLSPQAQRPTCPQACRSPSDYLPVVNRPPACARRLDGFHAEASHQRPFLIGRGWVVTVLLGLSRTTQSDG